MNRLTIEVNADMADEIVKENLKFLLSCLKKDLKNVKDQNRGFIFSLDSKEDSKEIKRHIDAFETVLRYYGEKL